MSIKKKIFVFFLFLFLILLLAWFFFGGTECIAYKVEKKDAVKGVTVTGTVKSVEDTRITAEVTAGIEEIFVKSGEYVTKGQILAYLTREEELGNIETAKSKIEVLKQQLERIQVQYTDAVSNEKRFEELYEDGAVSLRDLEEKTLKRQEQEESIDQTQQEIKVAQSELQVVYGKLENYIIKAPISGYVIEKFVSTGDVATPDKTLFRLVGLNNMYLSTEVEENELASVKECQKALVIFDAYPDRVYAGEVYKISKLVDPITGTFEARITKPPEMKAKILVGMTLDATIVLKEYADVLVVPANFVEIEDSKTYVFKESNYLAIKTPVESKFFDNNRVIILEGLKKGDIILKKAEAGKLTDNAKIKIKEFQE